jgi:NAD(P)-dependent dehydrogenase (short-subunit alcohol dehydrogenase family)
MVLRMDLPRLDGKTILVTGGTSGIGLEAAVELAKVGADVTIVGRDEKKTQGVLATIKERSGSQKVASLLCDFTSQASIRKLAADFRAGHDRLHVLVNNAGTVYSQRTLTEDGIESTFAVNHLGYFLLTNLLLDLIRASAPARIVNVSSTGHYQGTMNFDDLGFERGYHVLRAYARSKLGNVLFTRKLAGDLKDQKVTVNALHPGGVATGIWSHGPRWAQPFLALGKLFMITPQKGATRITYLAASPDVEGKTGLYFESNRPKTPSKLGQSDELATRLWTESAKLTKLSA